jgi:hypothetical protein
MVSSLAEEHGVTSWGRTGSKQSLETTQSFPPENLRIQSHRDKADSPSDVIMENHHLFKPTEEL